MKELPVVVLKGCPYIRASHTVCMRPVPLERELDLTWAQVMSFSRASWQRSPLVAWEGASGPREEGAGAKAMCEPGLLLCSLAITALFGSGVGSMVLKWKVLKWKWVGSKLAKSVLPLPSTSTLSSGGAVLGGVRKTAAGTWRGAGYGLWQFSCSQGPDASDALPVQAQ